MKKYFNLLVLMLAALLVAACGNGENSDSGSDTALDVTLLIETTGDLSFNDSAVAGIEAAQEEYGEQISTSIIEYGSDLSRMEGNFLDAADEGAEVIIVPSQFVDLVATYAPDYPETQFWLFDTDFDYEAGDYENVYSIVYSANEASYLGGYLAASTSDSNVIGFLGGMDTNIIRDFYVGYAQGALEADPDVQIVSSFVGAWDDSARGKELALSMYNQDASLVFNVAGGSGVGLIEAAVEQDRQVLGVDSDQAAMYAAQGQDEYAAVIPTSVLKNVGDSLHRAIGLRLEDNLTTGATEYLGLAEDGVGLADNDFFKEAYDQELIDEVLEKRQQIIDGEIEVQSAYDMSPEEIEEVENSVSP